MTPIPSKLTIAKLGEFALRIDLAEQTDLVLPIAKALQHGKPSCVRDIVPAYEVIVIHFDPDLIDEQQAFIEWIHSQLASAEEFIESSAKVVEVPVLYDETHGPDLSDSASQLGITVDELIELHTRPIYQVRMLGFMPGFPYLEGLDTRLALPRHTIPRQQVLTGSVGIGGNQTGIYPNSSSGGWNLIGRTPLSLFQASNVPCTLLEPGDSVRFRAITKDEFDSIGQPFNQPVCSGSGKSNGGVLEILSPGVQTILVDEGRWGYQHLGVSPGGPMDSLAARLANQLVGNNPTEVSIECNFVGPQIRFLQDALIAITGAVANDVPNGRPIFVHRGQEIDLRTISGGSRCYLAIRGGFEAEKILGSRSTNLRAQFGGFLGRDLKKGDRLSLLRNDENESTVQQPTWMVRMAALRSSEREERIRIIRGPQADWFSNEAWQQLLTQPFTIDKASDRTGIRLGCEQSLTTPSKSMLSEPIVMGAIQVPPSGEPIMMMADRQTVGGYPVIGIIASADIGRVAQLTSGSSIQFIEVDNTTAEDLRQQIEHQFQVACRGIELRE